MVKTKTQKQQEAAERQEKYDALSIADKIARAEKSPGESQRELYRLRLLSGEQHRKAKVKKDKAA